MGPGSQGPAAAATRTHHANLLLTHNLCLGIRHRPPLLPPSPSVKRYKSLGMQLYVRMDTVSGRSRMHNLSLRGVQDVHCLAVGSS